jgi:Rrf2 family protein
MATKGDGASLSIPEISRAEGLSIPNVAKLMRLLRIGGFVASVRGQAGGYSLSRPADQITVGSVLELLGGRLFGPSFCDRHAGLQDVCNHHTDCSLRSLWGSLQFMIEQILTQTTLKDLLRAEQDMSQWISQKTNGVVPVTTLYTSASLTTH